MTSLGDAWRLASERIDRLDARLLVQQVATCTHADLLAHAARCLSVEQVARLDKLVRRRAAGEPLAYLLGSAPFHDREFLVSPAVLIPRPETELLAELAIECLRLLPAAKVLDLGTGSGVLAVTLKCLFPEATVSAVDVSQAALDVARSNARRHAAEIRFLQGDWYAPLGEECFDLIVANPPYVADADPHLGRDGLPFEPQVALTDGIRGGDGLNCIRAVVSGASRHLLPGGWLLVEHGYNQATAVRHLLREGDLSGLVTWHDLSHLERVSGGCLR
ncbi:MAG: peptide chain release factor N(5)-glutamine methyltransferase [Candidatus Accumulibacter sp.]|uniref:peptide chain release factor N(5)-glutamine methyltransferase n=1 Tax=Accumulibacter sp. TaxID=2053492 RepID=UPI001A53B7A7|nr:peptide chain release factor N(5)-glutamine methyltransferase [Accumulibacter sp.]MBL8393588.1 peptide chain release factor N(5)-glutamine methyltransferase [Accumulibacter sp.]